jgi:hypothetical protein
MITIILCGLIFVGCGAFLMHRIGKRDDGQIFDAPARWIVTIALFSLLVATFRMLSGGGAAAGVAGLVVVIPTCVILGFIWVPPLVEHGLSGLTGALTGGNEQIAPKPYYFRAHARRKKGEYSAALIEIDSELEKFPGDIEGMLLKAEIHSDDLKDLPGAFGVLTEIETTPDRSATERVLAQFRRAELLITRANDIPGGKSVLEAIIEQNPESEAAHTARQRISHLPGQSVANRRPLVVVRHEESLGLTADLGASTVAVEDLGKKAAELVAHLEAHPDDWEAREKLAGVYADHYQRIPLAVEQIEQLIAQPGQPQKRVAGWLNRIADLHLRSDTGIAAARSALEQICARFPDSPAAEQATMRIAVLGRTEKAKAAPKIIKLGAYEQNIGLKRGSADIPNPDPDAS